MVPEGIVTSAGRYDVDTIVLATGFDAVTGAIRDHWADGASTYLGAAVAGFPKLFTITGPGSPSVLVNVVAAIEQHVDWILDHLLHLRAHGLDRSEATPAAEEWWNDQVAAAGQTTMHRHAASSWYVGTNVEGKGRRMLPYAGGLDTFRRISDEIAADGYRGFTMSAAPASRADAATAR